jgi:decaprenylphospho-beta-D-erythro-pentofuranosid-2-ulose 2-reductase
MQRILIIGANSSMAEAAARLWAKRGDRLFLLGRSDERLGALSADLTVRGAQMAGHGVFDANALDHHAEALEKAVHALGGLDVVLIAHGTLSEQDRAKVDVAYALHELTTNAISVVSLCSILANALEAQGHGTLAVISSVAGERGRQSNYLYGSAKALVTAFTQGLRNRLYSKGVHVVTLKPGFVATAMTAHLPQGPLFASADKAGACIVAAIDKKKDVAYVPGFWALIMFVIRAIPENLFKKLKL